MKKITLLVLLFFMTGCAGIPQQTEVPAQPTVEPTPGMLSELTTLVANTAEVTQVIVVTMSASDDFFSQMGISLASWEIF